MQSKKHAAYSQLGNLKLQFNGETIQAFDTRLETRSRDNQDILFRPSFKEVLYEQEIYTERSINVCKIIDLAFGSGEIPRNKKMNLSEQATITTCIEASWKYRI